MNLLQKTCLLSLALKTAFACVGTWTGGNSDGNWNSAVNPNMNWNNPCVPGTMAGDFATFAGVSPGTISLDGGAGISPTLSSLTFDFASANYTIAGTSHFINFDAPTSRISVLGNQTISAGVAGTASPLTLDINVSSGSHLALNHGYSDTTMGTTCTFTGPGELDFSAVNNNASSTTIGQTLTLASGTVTVTNFNNTGGGASLLIGIASSTNSIICGTNTFLEAINFGNQGNACSVTTAEMGGNSFTLNGGNLSCVNNGQVANGTGSQITTSSFYDGFGIACNGGTILCQNNSPVSGKGSFIHVNTGIMGSIGISLNGGSMTCGNSGSVNAAFGAEISTPTLNSNGGAIVVNNAGSVSNLGVGAFLLSNGAVNLNGGTLNITNTGTLSDTSGAQFICQATCTINGTTINNINNGSVSGPAAACYFQAITLNFEDGTITNSNNGTVTGSPVALIFASTINQSGGLMINNDTVNTANYNLTSTGIAAGSGNYMAASFSNAGTVIPGNPDPTPGIMTITGNYTQASNGTLDINMLSNSSFSQLVVTGSATLAGNLQVTLLPGGFISSGSTFEIVQGHPVTGPFSTVSFANFAGYATNIQYFPTYVLLTITGGPVTSYPNIIESVFNSVRQTNKRLGWQLGNLHDRIQSKNSPAPAKVAIASLQEAPLLVDNSTTLISLNAQNKQKQRQLSQTVATEPNTWNFYFGPTGNIGHMMTKKDGVGYNYDAVGALMGIDYACTEVGVGLLVDYDHVWSKVVHHWGKFHYNEVQADLYATYVPKQLPELAVNGILGGGLYWNHTRRNITSAPTAKGTSRGMEFNALLGIDYNLEHRQIFNLLKDLEIVPELYVQYIHANLHQYHERGSPDLDLNFRGQSAKSFRTNLGARFSYMWEGCNVSFTPEFNFAWQRELLDHTRRVKFSSDGTSSTVKLGEAGRNSGLAGVDFLLKLYQSYGVEASYDFEWNSLYRDHSFYLGANFYF